jgi:hypothetical protein
MKKMLLISGALLAIMATSAMAAGHLGLHLNDCAPTNSHTITNTCTNTGTIILCASVLPPANVDHFNSMEFVIDVAQAGAGPITPWWNMDGATGCVGRTGVLTASFDFTAVDTNGNPTLVACTDPWAGAASGGAGIVLPSTGTGVGPASARITGVGAIAGELPLSSANPTDYYMFFLRIGKAASAGSTPCTGCSTPTNIVLNNIKLGQPAGSLGGGDVSGDGGADQQCSYNGGNQPTAAKNTSWGSIKALYR